MVKCDDMGGEEVEEREEIEGARIKRGAINY